MTDNTELKRVAESANAVKSDVNITMAAGTTQEEVKAVQDFLQLAMPKTILALITENENLVAWREGLLKERAAHIRQRDQLKAENDRLIAENKQLILLECYGGTAQAAINLLAERDQFKAENEELREANDKFSRRNGMLEENVQAMTETHVLYTWLRRKVDQPGNDFVAVQMNIGHDWVPVHDLGRDLRSMIEREEP